MKLITAYEVFFVVLYLSKNVEKLLCVVCFELTSSEPEIRVRYTIFFFFDLLAFYSKGIYKGIQPKRAKTQQPKDKQKASKSKINNLL